MYNRPVRRRAAIGLAGALARQIPATSHQGSARDFLRRHEMEVQQALQGSSRERSALAAELPSRAGDSRNVQQAIEHCASRGQAAGPNGLRPAALNARSRWNLASTLDTQFSCMEKTVDFENEKAIGETWEIVDRYREEGRSGKDLERPEFKRLMADVQSGRINTVIVYKIDRITRSLRDFYTLWETFEQYDVQFVSLYEKFDTTTAVGRAMLKLILVFAELEREQTAERTRAAAT